VAIDNDLDRSKNTEFHSRIPVRLLLQKKHNSSDSRNPSAGDLRRKAVGHHDLILAA
jgi:hypothetical protein